MLKNIVSLWTWRMAWRDSRASRRKLVLFSCSIVLGIAALTAIGSLGTNLERAIQEQSKNLLGADLVIGSRQPFDAQEDQLFREIGGVQSREITFSSMVYFSSTEGTRLVQVRALDPGFPFYGALETDPLAAATEFRKSGGALVEESLLTQFGAKVGEEVRLGKLTTRIFGSLKKVPGESVAFATIAPRVYISMADLPRTELLREGSLSRYRVYFKLDPAVNVSQLLARIKPQLEEYRLSTDTVEERQRELGRSMERMYHFLNLVGFIALLLGGVGVASAIHVHVKEKLGTVAVLRCIGGTVAQTFAVYLAQGMALGVIGALAGAGLGLVIQSALPRVLGDFIPFTFEFRTSWLAVGKATGIGFAICLLFALMPLLAVRRVSPLVAIRVAFEPASARDPLRWLVGILLAAGVVGFALTQSRDWRIGLWFAAGLGVVFGLLALTARLLIFAARRTALARLPFAVRQGIANLHRPNNRTLLLLLSLGLGTFLIVSLFLVQQNLLTQLVSAEGNQQANAVMFDIQPDQREPLTNLVRSLGVPILDEAPIINMRLRAVKGEPVQALLKDRTRRIPRWALRREYRSTYNDRLRDGEKLVAGTWHARATNGTDVVPISLEQGIANELNAGVGDELEFDVQGVPVKTRVASVREVNWRRVQPNFFVVFPRGAIEDAPAMHVLVSRVRSSEESARLQREVVKRFPNVSVIDLSLILQTLDSILEKISFVIRFMAMFTVATGLLVLAGALLTGRYQRVQESVLLRTLGASRKQIFLILLVEYFVLGLLAALTGVILALLAAWALAVFVFKMKYAPALPPLLIAVIGLPLLTVTIGFLMNRGVVNQPPLVILRAAAASILLLATSAMGATFRFEGKVGERIDANVRNWLCRAPAANPAMLEMFAARDRQPKPDLVDWAGEFVGKYLISGVQAMRMSGDPCLRATLSNVVERLVSLQAEDGYLGPWPKNERLLGHWDLWGHYHVILGLLLWNEQTGDAKALVAARRAADLACKIYLDGKRRVLDAGSHEMNMSSLHGF
ncbi:MAG TPA: FtsX-like permease family protein, partial [Verrucomicrobiae bacterium]|nr:FtsX-like permease family protein [Verrucomicrobiae bacterium]